jgi:DNA-binding response OmpR family regulator
MDIMIAEDDKDLQRLIAFQLEQEGYSCETVSDGIQALERIKAHRFHLAIFDVMMPYLDGFNLLRKLRETNNHTPVIFLTARSDDMDKVLGLGLGADDYIVKPFNMAELIARVGAVLRRSYNLNQPDNSPSCLTYGCLALNQESCNVYVDGKPAELGAKEFKLLKLFMENPGRVYTKKQLYTAVWDEDIFFDDNTVMVHISRLRNKIESDPKAPQYIKTVRGIGYKFQYDGEL